jgi:malonyl-CoA decarboxylase
LSALRLATRETAPERDAVALVRGLLETERRLEDAALADALREPLIRLCAVYLTTSADNRGPADPVARFHLGNGARLERVNWLGNVAPRGINESYGIMVNYLYDPEQIEANHEAFVRGTIVRSAAVDALLGTPARPAARVKSQSEKRTRRSRKR